MAKSQIKLKSFIALEREVKGVNALQLVNKAEKSATDLLYLAFVILHNEGKVKTLAEAEELDSDVITEALKKFGSDDEEKKAE